MKKSITYLNGLLKDNDTIVIALSGGPDSMCLLDIILKLQLNLKIICIHINHGIRKESTKEYQFIKEYLKDKPVILEYKKIDKKSQISNYNEEELREKRYTIFKEIINKYQAKYLFTAHHGDDLIETILMRINRGSTLKGYSGFQLETKQNNYTIVRPLIYVTKNDIEDYNKKNNIPYVIDQTNFSLEYTRNRYRHIVLPFLKKENPNAHLKYLSYSIELLKYYEYVDNVVNKELNRIYSNNVLNIELYLGLDSLIQEKVLEAIIKKIYNDDINLINNKHIESIIKMINNKKPNISINLPSNIIVTKSYNNLIFETNKIKENGYLIKVSNITKLPNNKTIYIIDDTEKKDNNYIKLNTKEIKLPLYVRTRKEGDKMTIKNMSSPKKIKDIFIDCKLSMDKRDSQPLLVDANNTILWIPGLKKSKFDKEKSENYDIILWYN